MVYQGLARSATKRENDPTVYCLQYTKAVSSTNSLPFIYILYAHEYILLKYQYPLICPLLLTLYAVCNRLANLYVCFVALKVTC